MRAGKDLLEEPLSDVSRAYVYGGTDNLRKKVMNPKIFVKSIVKNQSSHQKLR
jgi:hypothetical protein